MMVETVLTNPTKDTQTYGWVKHGGIRLAPDQSVTIDGCVYTLNKQYPGNQRRMGTDIQAGRIKCVIRVQGADVEKVADVVVEEPVIVPVPKVVTAEEEASNAMAENIKSEDLKIFEEPMTDMVTGEAVPVPVETNVGDVYGFLDTDAVKAELRLNKYSDIKALASAMGNVSAKSVISKEEAIKWIVDSGDIKAWTAQRCTDALNMGAVELTRKALELAANKI